MIIFEMMQEHTKTGGTSLEGRDYYSDTIKCSNGRHMNVITKSKNTVFVREY